jgi:plastocyanin
VRWVRPFTGVPQTGEAVVDAAPCGVRVRVLERVERIGAGSTVSSNWSSPGVLVAGLATRTTRVYADGSPQERRRRDVRLRLGALTSAATLVAVGVATGATAVAMPKLHGTIGPGYTISLKNAKGKKVTTLKHGKYTFIVGDKSSIHNFTLNGPGTKNKTISGTGFVGTKTVTLTLKKGTYRFYCTVHPTITGTFKVT